MIKKESLIVACLIVGSIVSCTMMQPDLSALYGVDQWPNFEEDTDYIQPPIVIIPGIVSSTLVDETGKEVWTGPWFKTLFGDYENLALDIDADTLLPKRSTIRAGRLPEKILFFDFYGSLFNVLESYGNYRHTEIGTPYETRERRYYKFPYDWRYDSVAAAEKLDEFIEKIRADYGMPDLEVDLIAHSMGGLVARYYMRYGTEDVLDDNEFPVTQAGAKKVRRLVLLGAPNLGSVAVLHQMMEGYKVVLGRVPVEVMATMPSIYQLFPHPFNTWLIDMEGKPLNWDLYFADLWRDSQWGIFDPDVIARVKSQYANEAEGQARVELLQRYFGKHLERARRFVWSLTVLVPGIEYSIVAFGGNCEPTPARLLIENIDGDSVLRLWPDEIKKPIKGVDYSALMLEPGDGRVTKPSVLARNFLNPAIARQKYSFFPLDYAFFLCNNHGQMTGNINFQDNLLNVLLERRTHYEMQAEMGR